MKLKRIALVIGNGNYVAKEFDKLSNAAPDASQIAKSLEDRGFETDLRADLDADQMSTAIAAFNEKIAATPCFAVFYYAGHGCEQHGLTYLYPVDMPGGNPSLVPRYGVPMTEILGEPHPEGTPRILILDCCRTSETSWTSDERTRFEEVATAAKHRGGQVHRNTLIAYSTSSGESAFDGSGSNGPYCAELSPLLQKHRLTVEDVFKDVGMLVSNASKGRQRPWFYSNLSSDLTFSDLPNVVATVAVETPLVDGTKGLLKDPHDSRVIAYRDGDHKAHCIDGIAGHGHYEFDEPVQSMTAWRNGLIVYNHRETLWKEETGGLYAGMKLEIKEPLWVASSPTGDRVAFGGTSSFYLVDIPRGSVYEVDTPNQSWYTALFLDETRAWIAGSSGGLREVEFGNNEPIVRNIELHTQQMLYTICRVDDSNVVIGGSRGKVYKISLSDRRIVWTRELGGTVRTPAARMQSILDTATDNEIIRRFLFEPENLTAEQGSCLSDSLASNDLLFSASTPSSPILVVASNEGLLYLVDHRDGRDIEVVDNAAGRATGIEGICFLDPHQFAVLDQIGTVRLYSLADIPYETALRYVDEADWGNDGDDIS
ncbi:caspase family protein [Burkholderia pseudomallei]|uniref:caspase family protein n=1 Tax=Burkholderia pseudomallei TaxID=28450 RepID=UPI000F07BBF6|nr:caspase family protein [Burkholderia pseudomallei]MBF3650906.1 caspase family protein [Burkholderia pseudomallei]MBF3668914.1 caspase family protein [Burkholderia pseudomallei]MBF3774371.1 caspase family protein [Burkholderia pseudomallei]MBF3873409.1 caspase family protein [Burkholderia pseudomallei]MBF3907680.1 caspase family protein [Burkholderia pseudomallei]